MEKALSRRAFAVAGLTAASAVLLGGCASKEGVEEDAGENAPRATLAEATDALSAGAEVELPPLPMAAPDTDNQFLIDKNINISNVDDWLGRDDVAYRDMRMIHDPADYEAIGGNSELSVTIEGFRVTPYPLIGTLQELPVSGAYEGERLFDVEWNGGEVASATPRYEESMTILEELFPKDKALFIMCGGAGYAFMMRQLLAYLGWDESKLYNLGGAWDYVGRYPVELMRYENGEARYMLWRGDIVDFGIEYLTPVS